MMRPELKDAVVTGCGIAVSGVAGPGDLLAAGRAASAAGFDPETGLRGRDLRHRDRASRFALRAAEPALNEAGLSDGERYTGPEHATAVVVSCNLGNLDSVCQFADTIAEHTVTGLSPLGLPQTSTNEIAGWLAIRYRMRGPNVTLCNGATSGLDALHWAANLIAARRAEVVLVVGVEPDTEPVARLLDDGTGRPRLDGAAALVVEAVGHATRRGVPALAQLRGYARSPRSDEALARVRATAPGPISLLLARDGGPLPGDGRVLDLTARLGHCSGALGVLQGAAGVSHLREDSVGAVLAVAGGEPRDDAAAALLLTAAAGVS
ncbi:hypothetical protein NGB36_09985 [Streptomyces sp. RB6PN25]|uniref:Beta-ketoacyl synthase-like N-terminal domain-containing protein n=1 Tax=Streptomyces humicola TaxID=2953240 RepID=A0ABT1PV81_9ACTN|nr:beta-ketoacyl synthase N-terminal-like domain-containing protein [Streptomyces humicola]MCQ4080920.1 hypothetical protein [Streptomyces humicola]